MKGAGVPDGQADAPRCGHGFDSVAAAAAALTLLVSSGFRSDTEQARLFSAHPDPKWVAPPGGSLHRYATELDLGPAAAYGWLAANATCFGFLQRYSWEPWHSE
jgi:LAS superfamily LD-carboxypeptidase LdcB